MICWTASPEPDWAAPSPQDKSASEPQQARDNGDIAPFVKDTSCREGDLLCHSTKIHFTAMAAPRLAGLGGGLVALGNNHGCVDIYSCQAHDGELDFVLMLAGHTLKVTALAFSDATDVLVSGSLDCSVVVWRRSQMGAGGRDAAPADQQQGGAMWAGQRIVFDEPVTALALTPCGKTLVVAHGYHTSFWDLSARRQACRVGAPMKWPSSPRALALKPGGSMHFAAVGR